MSGARSGYHPGRTREARGGGQMYVGTGVIVLILIILLLLWMF